MTHLALLKIKTFRNLETGWCHGEGVPARDDTVSIAERIATRLLRFGFGELDAFPGLDGEIRVTAYEGANYFEFTVESPGLVTFLHERNDVEVSYDDNLSVAQCLKKIEALKGPCKSSLESFTHDTMIKEEIGSTALRSSHHPSSMVKASLYSSTPAVYPPAAASAATYSAITPMSLDNPLFFGSSSKSCSQHITC